MGSSNNFQLDFGGTFSERIDHLGNIGEPRVSHNTGYSNDGSITPGTRITPFYFYNLLNNFLISDINTSSGHSWLSVISRDYIYAVTIKLVSLSAFYYIPSKKLAPFVSFDDYDTDSQKTEKLIKAYNTFEKVGLRMWSLGAQVYMHASSPFTVPYGTTATPIWMPRGETILQNKGIEVKINLLPYLGSTYIDYSGGIGIQITDKGNGVLSSGDYINIVGEWECRVCFMPKVTGVINLMEVVRSD